MIGSNFTKHENTCSYKVKRKTEQTGNKVFVRSFGGVRLRGVAVLNLLPLGGEREGAKVFTIA